MRRRLSILRNRIELSDGKVVKTRRFKYIAEDVTDQERVNKCEGCALVGKRFECNKMSCQYIKRNGRTLLFKTYILKQIE